MNKINDKRLTATTGLITLLITGGLLFKKNFFEHFQIKSTDFNWIYVIAVAFFTFLLSKFFIDKCLNFFFSRAIVKRNILERSVEGYWYVEWFDIEDGDESEVFVGNELTKFYFSNDLSCLKEISTHFQNHGDEMTSTSKYQIHLNEELHFANSFSYIKGIRINHASSRIYFSPDADNEKKVSKYEALCIGFEEKYREKHKGRPIDSAVIKKYIGKFGKDIWKKKFLENKGVPI